MPIPSIARKTGACALLALGLLSCGDADPVAPVIPADEVPPAAVSDLRLGTRTDSTLTLLWTSPGDDGEQGSAWRYDVRRATEPIADSTWGAAIQITGEPVPGPAGRTELFIVRGLGAEPALYFALRTIDHAGNVSPLSNVAEAPALDTVAPGQVVDLTALALGGGEVELSWTTTGDDGDEGTATGYVVRHADFPLDADNFRSGILVGSTPVPEPAGRKQVWRLDVGNAGERWFAIQVWDEAGNAGPLSNVVRVEVR